MTELSNLLNIKEPPTPELDRESAHGEEARIIRDFLEWLQCDWHSKEKKLRHINHNDEWISLLDVNANTILYEYFDLDPNKLEHERQLILLYARKIAEMCTQERALKDADLTQTEKALLIHSRVLEAGKRIRKEMGL